VSIIDELLEEEPDLPGKYSLRIYETVEKTLSDLARGDRKLAKQIARKIRALKTNPRPPGCTRLTGGQAWRVRVRDWRVLYEIKDDILIVAVVDMAPRDIVYKRR